MTREIHVIAGAGQAGVHAAVALRDAGFAGDILLLGEEAHPPYERPPLSKAALTAEVEPPPSYFYPATKLAERRISLRLSTRATALDLAAQRLSLDDGTSLPYDRLLLATGARPRRLGVPGAEWALGLRHLDDARRLRGLLRPGAHVVCIGAGVIGLELASSARQRGCDVLVVEVGQGAMGRSLIPPVARHLETLHRAAGVELRFGCSVRAIEPGMVRTDAGDIPADVVVAGIGVERNVELATAAGLAEDRGILVDECNRTSAPAVFAAGDATAFWHPGFRERLRLESWKHAQNHGIAAGRAMAGHPRPYRDIPWFWSDQLGVNLQVAGRPERGAHHVWRGTPGDDACVCFCCDDAGILRGVIGLDAAREVRAAVLLIELEVPLPEDKLCDPAFNLQRFGMALKAAGMEATS